MSELEGATDSFVVAGRGEMHLLSILIETMRREGYEFAVSPPRVLFREIDGKKCEPIERVVVDVPSEYIGSVIEKLGSRRGEFLEMLPVGNRTKATFLVPERGLFGYRNEFLTDTKGEGILSSVFERYEPYKGDLSRRGTGSLIAWETGEAVTYGLFNAQERGALFIGPGTQVYAGMIVGVSPKNEDIPVNVCRRKQLTNMRAAGSDEALRLTPPRHLSLEQCLEFLADDELLEVTPQEPAPAQAYPRPQPAHEGPQRRPQSLTGRRPEAEGCALVYGEQEQTYNRKAEAFVPRLLLYAACAARPKLRLDAIACGLLYLSGRKPIAEKPRHLCLGFCSTRPALRARFARAAALASPAAQGRWRLRSRRRRGVGGLRILPKKRRPSAPLRPRLRASTSPTM